MEPWTLKSSSAILGAFTRSIGLAIWLVPRIWTNLAMSSPYRRANSTASARAAAPRRLPVAAPQEVPAVPDDGLAAALGQRQDRRGDDAVAGRVRGDGGHEPEDATPLTKAS
jgi:hypothetical protein